MVVSESESEVLSDSESQPMSEHQSANDGALVNLPITAAQGLEIKQELNQSDSDKKELDPEVLKKGTEANDREHSQHCTEPKKHEKNEAAGDDVNRPLVLEERHSLSIAETKKRRASIYSNELLFIPKELARSELQQRTRTLSRYAKNREYHLRMLKFPVGSGRPRYVAEQMKKARACGQPNFKQVLDGSQMGEDDVAIKQEEEIIDEVHEELQVSSESPQNMPELEVQGGVKNQLPDDEEISNILFDLVKQEVEENEALEEINRKILQSQRQSVIRTATSRLQHYPYLRWHKLDRDVLDSNTGLETPCKVKTEPEVPEIYGEFPICGTFLEVSGDFNQIEDLVEDVQEQEQEKEPQLPDGQDEPLQAQLQNTEPINYLPQCEAALQMQIEQPQLLAEVPANNSTAAAPRSPGIGGQATNSVLRQHLMHHIVQPNTLSEELLQSNSCNNNADDRVNQNLGQPQFLETSFPPEIGRQWNVPGVENYADQAFHNQQLLLQQQYLYSQQYQQQQQLQLQQQQIQQQHEQQHQQQHQQQQQEQHQQQHQQQQQLILYHQHQHKLEDKVQEMRLMYQRIKCREEEQLHQYGKTLKKIQEERLACERRHAEEKRVFLLKMDQSRKLEEKLKSEKEQLLRQLRSDLRTLELRISEQQRQQEEKALAWSWQHQQQQLQLQRHQLLAHQQSQPQQPHFLHHQQHSQEVEAPQGQYMTSQSQPNQEQYPQHHQIVNQQHTLLYDPPSYVYQPAYQESNVYQQRLQAYRDQFPPNPAESHAGAIRDTALEMPRRLLLPPPPYCPTNSRSETSLSSRKIRHRRLTTDHRSEPYAVQVRAPPAPSAPPQADYLQFPRNSQISSTTDSSHNQRGNHLEITSVMANYVASFINNRGE